MSHKQLRKLREIQEAAAAEASKAIGNTNESPTGTDDAGGDGGADSEASADANVGGPAVSAFALLGSDSDNSEEEEAEENNEATEVAATPKCVSDEKEADVPKQRKEAKKKDSENIASGYDSDGLPLEDSLGNFEGQEAEAADNVDGAISAGQLSMRRADFSLESERRRAIGGFAAAAGVAAAIGPQQRQRKTATKARGAAEGRTAHHRRLFLVIPTAEEPWHRPDDGASMTASVGEDGSPVFALEDNSASRKLTKQLKACLGSEDPQALQVFLERHPFCTDGLLTFAEYHRGHHQHEQTFQFVRRAVYAVECRFGASFSPFHVNGVGLAAGRPRTTLHMPAGDPTWPGWSWLRALWMYMQCLSSQGMHRTALEVCKFLLSMTLPHDPVFALLYFDFLCLRARQYNSLLRLSAHLVPLWGLDSTTEDTNVITRLDLILPNFAYSVALAHFLKADKVLDATALNGVSVGDVVDMGNTSHRGTESQETDIAEENSDDKLAGAALMRALLLFPLALMPLLQEMGVDLHASLPSSRERWSALLEKRPFCDAADFRHGQHGNVHTRICVMYAKRCGALWRADAAARWLHAGATRLAGMHRSSIFADDLIKARATWQQSQFCLWEALEEHYHEVQPDDGLPENAPTPPCLRRAAEARLQPDVRDRLAGNRGAFGAGAGMVGEDLVPTFSLHSPPLLIFLQALLPWAVPDRSGGRVDPLGWLDVGRNASGVLHSTGLFFVGLACDIVRLSGHLVAKLGDTIKKQATLRQQRN